MQFEQTQDLSITWVCFLIKAVGLWMAADRAEQRKRNFAFIYSIVMICSSWGIGARDVYFSWGNFEECTYIACSMLYVAISFFKIAVVYVHKLEFFDLVLFTYKHFWHSDYDPKEKLILADCRRTCAFFLSIISFCACGTGAGYIVTPLITNIGKNDSEKILPFNMWIDFPIGQSPYFEILFTLQTMCVYHVGIIYVCFDNFLCLVNLHAAGQFRILHYRLENLRHFIEQETVHSVRDKSSSNYMNEYYMKSRKCIEHHQSLIEYCKKLEYVFSLVNLGQVLFFGIVICLVACQIFLMESPPSRLAGLILNMCGTLVQAFIFTYSCDDLNRQNASIGPIIFSGQWLLLPMNKIGRNVRKNVLIIIMRSNQNCSLTAAGFFPVSLETYTTVLSTAMSYFTLLRQSTVDAAVTN